MLLQTAGKVHNEGMSEEEVTPGSLGLRNWEILLFLPLSPLSQLLFVLRIRLLCLSVHFVPILQMGNLEAIGWEQVV